MLAYDGILSDGDIDNVLAYIADPSKAEAAAPATPPATDTPATATPDTATAATDTPAAAPTAPKGKDLLLWYWESPLQHFYLSSWLFVFKTNREIKKVSQRKQPRKNTSNKVKYYPLWNVFVKNKIITVVVGLLLFFTSTYFAYGYLMQVGVDQGYQPIQEIHYSHKIHAGDNQIDCKFCHSAARTSKTAGIPSLNVCMNCHKTIE